MANKHDHEHALEEVFAGMPGDGLLCELGDLFKIFGDTSRIKILFSLFESDLCVLEITKILGMEQSAVSHQLNILRRSKLVKTRREGKSVYYSLDDEHVYEIISCGIEHISEGDA